MGVRVGRDSGQNEASRPRVSARFGGRRRPVRAALRWCGFELGCWFHHHDLRNLLMIIEASWSKRVTSVEIRGLWRAQAIRF